MISLKSVSRNHLSWYRYYINILSSPLNKLEYFLAYLSPRVQNILVFLCVNTRRETEYRLKHCDTKYCRADFAAHIVYSDYIVYWVLWINIHWALPLHAHLLTAPEVVAYRAWSLRIETWLHRNMLTYSDST